MGGRCAEGPRRAPPTRDLAARVVAGASGHRHRRPLRRGHPFRDLAAPERPQGGRPRVRATRRHASALPSRARRDEQSSARSSTTTGPPGSSDCETSPRPPNEKRRPTDGRARSRDHDRRHPRDDLAVPHRARPARRVGRHRRRDRPTTGRLSTACSSRDSSSRRASTSKSSRCRRSCSRSVGSRKATRSRRARRPSRSRCIPRATRPACGSCTAAFPTTRSSDHGDGWQHYLERLAIRAAGGAVPADTGPGAASA